MLFGAWGVAARLIHIPSPVLIFIMTGSAAAVLLPFNIKSLKGLLKDYHALLVSLNLALDLVLLTEAYRRVNLAIAVSIHYIGPVIAVLIAPWILRERFHSKFLAFMFIALIGGWFLSGPSLAGKADEIGLLLALGSAVTLAGNIVLQRRYMRRDGSNPIEAVFKYNVFLTGFMFVPAVITGIKFPSLTAVRVSESVVSGILIQGIAMLLFNYAAKSLTVKALGIISYTEIFWASIFGLIIFSQLLTFLQIFGMVLIIMASILSNLSLDENYAK